jgi:tagatose 1,6-diphosphate aldolase
LVGYSLHSETTDTAIFAREKPGIVIQSAAEFSKERYGVDILKLEFPADLKWTKELQRCIRRRRPRGRLFTGRSAQTLRRVEPGRWNAVGNPQCWRATEEFLVQLDLATDAGASGFLCGR